MKERIELAKSFAIGAHRNRNQMYDTFIPYEYHLEKAVEAFTEFWPIRMPNAMAPNQLIVSTWDQNEKQNPRKSDFLDLKWHSNIVCALWCHDLYEDCGLSFNDIKKIIGEDAKELVYLVSDEKGRNRKEKHAKTYPALAQNPYAITVKLCDRIANVKFSILTESRMGRLYKEEQEEFRAALYSDSSHVELKSLWGYLEGLLGNIK